jgi:hypothetical protein
MHLPGVMNCREALLGADARWQQLRTSQVCAHTTPSSLKSIPSHGHPSQVEPGLQSPHLPSVVPAPLQDVGPAPNFVHTSSAPISPSQPAQQQYDVAVCGGTLGIFAATALAQQGFRVAVIEGGPLRGRDQV